MIVGGGVAAQRCAFELRRLGFDGAVTMVCEEAVLPYDRTWLTKQHLLRPEDSAPALLRAATCYEDERIDARLGVRASALDADRRRIALSDGSDLAFDRLVIACGGRATAPSALHCPGVVTVRTVEDLAPLRAALAQDRHVAVVGGGFIGGEVATAAVARGVSVTMFEEAEAPLVDALGSEVATRIARLHRTRGVDLRTRTRVVAVRPTPNATNGFEVEDDDGHTTRVDAVVLGCGMRPALDWLIDSGVEVEDGVLTDQRCATTVDGVLAAGDCARWHSARYQTTMRVEHWDTAGRHGQAAAAAVLGAQERFDPVPFFWSVLHDVRMQWVGFASGFDRVEIEERDSPERFVARYYADGRLRAVFAVQQPHAIVEGRAALFDDSRTLDEPVKGAA